MPGHKLKDLHVSDLSKEMKLICEAFEKILRSSENFWGESVHKTQMGGKSFYPEAALLHLKEQKKQKKTTVKWKFCLHS